MRLKSNFSKETKLKAGSISCLSWASNEEVYSCSDDHQIHKWNVAAREALQVAKLPEDFMPSDMDWLLRSAGGSKGSECLLIGSVDGRFVILNKSARVEKNVAAHSGAITAARWSPDGVGLLTAGEDGVIKVWSRSGMLRSTVIQSEQAVRSARWAPNSQAIVYTQGGHVAVKPLAANSKVVRWKAHEGLVLGLSWSGIDLIASGGEDGRYKIWDSQGTNIFTSTTDDYPITTVEFSPDGGLLAVGSFNLLKLCNSTGWNYSIERYTENPQPGSLFNMCWSPDGTQVTATTSSGDLIFGHIVGKEISSKNLKAVAKGRKTIILQDLVAGTSDTLEFSDRIIKWELGYGHLVAATPNQIQIFNENYINTPIIVDGRSDIRIIQLGKKYFLAVDGSSIWVYTYNGRLHLNPRYAGSQTQVVSLTRDCISLGLDHLAVRDSADQTTIYVFDLLPGATRQEGPASIKTKTAIVEVAVSQAGGQDDQYLVFIDVNRDLYICHIQAGSEFQAFKIGTQVISAIWSSGSNMLVGLHDSCYSLWHCPGESCQDPSLIALTTATFDTSEMGKNVSLESFEGSYITFRSGGAAFTIGVKPYFEILHKCISDGMWTQALKLCRMTQDTTLWATLAAIATKQNQLEISEEAYAAALQIDKVKYLQHIKTLPKGSSEQMAEISVMNGRVAEAEVILLHGKKIQQAIELCLRMHRWTRALEIAQKNNSDLEMVLEERKKYLAALGKKEWDENFLKIGVHNGF